MKYLAFHYVISSQHVDPSSLIASRIKVFQLKKKIVVDESLLRNHACDFKTHWTIRAGKPHRSLNICRNVLVNLGNCPCNYSLLSTYKLHTDFLFIQSISSDGLFFLQRIYIYCSLFLLMDNKRRGFIFYFKLCFF